MRALLGLAWPVVAAEIGWMAMWTVDTLVVGRVDAVTVAAVSVGGHYFFTVAVFGMGMLFGLDFLVAHAWGGGRTRDAQHVLAHGLVLALAVSAVLTVGLLAAVPLLDRFGLNPAILPGTRDYFVATSLGLTPLLLFTALRRYLQSVGAVRSIFVVLTLANGVNLLADGILVLGWFGGPRLGAAGAGWATWASRCFLALALGGVVTHHLRASGSSWAALRVRPERRTLGELVRLGLPAAAHTSLEVGVFAVATSLAGRLSTEATAAHQIALNVAALIFMVPLGLGSAGAVRVGQALGRGDADAARRAGWQAFAVAIAIAFAASLAIAVLRRPIIGLYGVGGEVTTVATALLLIAALFHVPDAVQAVATGILRGTGDTRSAALANGIGHWLIGLPVGAYLCFGRGWGVRGIWWGFVAGLTAVGVALTVAWIRRGAALIPSAQAGANGDPRLDDAVGARAHAS